MGETGIGPSSDSTLITAVPGGTFQTGEHSSPTGKLWPGGAVMAVQGSLNEPEPM